MNEELTVAQMQERISLAEQRIGDEIRELISLCRFSSMLVEVETTSIRDCTDDGVRKVIGVHVGITASI